MMKLCFLCSIFLVLAPLVAGAAPTGRAAALKYFSSQAKQQVVTRSPSEVGLSLGGQRLLAVAVGSLINSRSYNWTEESAPGWNVELFYQSASEGYFAKGFHLELQKFAIDQQELSKVAFLYSFTFPRRLSFPVYIGVAAGPSYFIRQSQNESHFAFDYKAYLGLRLHQKHSQYFIQSGVKNHVHVLSDGQFVGWFISSGVAYTF
jgi:hypothetical protein